MTLSGREAINDLLRNRQPQRVGLMESIWADALAGWVEQGYPTRTVHRDAGDLRWRRSDGRMIEAETAGEYEEPVPPWQHFGFDMASVGPWMDVLPLRGYSELVEETDEWDVKRNGAGASLKYWKHKSGTPEHIDFRMTSRDIWERDYRRHLLQLDPERVNLKEMRRNYRLARDGGAWVHMGHMFIWENMRRSMGDLTLYESLLLDPAWVHDYNRVHTDFFKLHFAYIFVQVGMPDGVWIYEDLGYKNGLFASPKVLSEMIFPYFAELVAFFHGYGLPVILHTCGSTAEAIPLIIEAGFDGLNPMERKALGNDPFAYADKYGDKLCFVGGLDTRVFETNDKDTIRKEIATYISGMKARGARLVFASDHSISTRTLYASYRYGVEVYREHMMY